MTKFSDLLDGYRRFRSTQWQTQRQRWDELKEGQSPKVMIIACSDSRVDPTQIFDTNPGETFIVRNVAALVPPLFAIVQPELPAWIPGAPPQDNYIYAAIVFVAVSFWQFSIGNFIQPRMMGESLNLSALVVLLSLAIWGAIWGIPGMFLSAPLTVLMMIFFAQSSSTRWIAILLSADGNPQGKCANSTSEDAEATEPAYGENR